MLRAARSRAAKLGLPYELDESSVEWNTVCPVLGTRLDYGPKDHQGGDDHSPSIDRLDPDLGYVAENVAVISLLANRIKSNSEAALVRQVADWLEGQEEE